MMLKINKIFGISLIILSIILIVLLFFIKTNFDDQSVILCENVENNPNLEMASCPAHTSSTPNLIMITFGISILIFISGVLLLFFKFETNKPDKNTVSKFKNHDLSDLSDDEKKIYEFIKSEGGSIYQSNIINKTGYSKVKITRILDTLEYDHKLIDRKRRGMTNIVILK